MNYPITLKNSNNNDNKLASASLTLEARPGDEWVWQSQQVVSFGHRALPVYFTITVAVIIRNDVHVGA